MGTQGRTFRGIVIPGRGFGAKSMSTPSSLQAIRQLTGLDIIPGTLNVRLPHRFDGLLNRYVTEKELGGNVWGDYVPNRAGLKLVEVTISGPYRGFVFQGDEPEYPADQVEVISDQNLRETLGLQDGDTLEFSICVGQNEDKER